MSNFIEDQKEIRNYYLEEPEKYGGNIDFAFYQAEKFLESTIKNSHKIQEKSHNLMTLSLALTTALLGFLYFVLTKDFSKIFEIVLIVLSIISLMVIAVVMWGLLKASKVETVYYLGRSPDFILNNQNMNLSVYQIKIKAIMDYNHSIVENMKMADKRSSYLEFSHNLFIYYIMLLVLVLTFTFVSVAFGVISINQQVSM